MSPMPVSGQIMGQNRQVLRIGPELFSAIENQIRWAQGVPRKLPVAMDRLVRFMAYTNLGIAQKMSLGPHDPNQANPSYAWKIPVRRISGRYFFGWKVRRRGVGTWQLYNDSREAFFIEYGIHTSGRRVRRPIRKLSLIKTMKFMHKTEVYHRIWSSVYMPDPSQRKGLGFTWRIQGPGTMNQGIFPMGRLP